MLLAVVSLDDVRASSTFTPAVAPPLPPVPSSLSTPKPGQSASQVHLSSPRETATAAAAAASSSTVSSLSLGALRVAVCEQGPLAVAGQVAGWADSAAAAGALVAASQQKQANKLRLCSNVISRATQAVATATAATLMGRLASDEVAQLVTAQTIAITRQLSPAASTADASTTAALVYPSVLSSSSLTLSFSACRPTTPMARVMSQGHAMVEQSQVLAILDAAAAAQRARLLTTSPSAALHHGLVRFSADLSQRTATGTPVFTSGAIAAAARTEAAALRAAFTLYYLSHETQRALVQGLAQPMATSSVPALSHTQPLVKAPSDNVGSWSVNLASVDLVALRPSGRRSTSAGDAVAEADNVPVLQLRTTGITASSRSSRSITTVSANEVAQAWRQAQAAAAAIGINSTASDSALDSQASSGTLGATRNNTKAPAAAAVKGERFVQSTAYVSASTPYHADLATFISHSVTSSTHHHHHHLGEVSTQLSWALEAVEVTASPDVGELLTSAAKAGEVLKPLYGASSQQQRQQPSAPAPSSDVIVIGEELTTNGTIGSVVLRAVSNATEQPSASSSPVIVPTAACLVFSVSGANVSSSLASGHASASRAQGSDNAATSSSSVLADHHSHGGENHAATLGPRRLSVWLLEKPPENSSHALIAIRPIASSASTFSGTVTEVFACALGGALPSKWAVRGGGGSTRASVLSGHSGSSSGSGAGVDGRLPISSEVHMQSARGWPTATTAAAGVGRSALALASHGRMSPLARMATLSRGHSTRTFNTAISAFPHRAPVALPQPAAPAPAPAPASTVLLTPPARPATQARLNNSAGPPSGRSDGASSTAGGSVVNITHTTPTRIRMTPDQAPVREENEGNGKQQERIASGGHATANGDAAAPDLFFIPPPSSWPSLGAAASCALDGATAVTTRVGGLSVQVALANGALSTRTSSSTVVSSVLLDLPLYGLDLPVLHGFMQAWIAAVGDAYPSAVTSVPASSVQGAVAFSSQHSVSVTRARLRVQPLDSLQLDYELSSATITAQLGSSSSHAQAAVASSPWVLDAVKASLRLGGHQMVLTKIKRRPLLPSLVSPSPGGTTVAGGGGGSQGSHGESRAGFRRQLSSPVPSGAGGGRPSPFKRHSTLAPVPEHASIMTAPVPAQVPLTYASLTFIGFDGKHNQAHCYFPPPSLARPAGSPVVVDSAPALSWSSQASSTAGYSIVYNAEHHAASTQLFKQLLPTVCVSAVGNRKEEPTTSEQGACGAVIDWQVETFIDRMTNTITPAVYTHILGLQGRLSAEISAATQLLARSITPTGKGQATWAAPAGTTTVPAVSAAPPGAPFLSASSPSPVQHRGSIRLVQAGVVLTAYSSWLGGTGGAVACLDTGVIAVSVSSSGRGSSAAWEGSLSFDKLTVSLSEPGSRRSIVEGGGATGPTKRPAGGVAVGPSAAQSFSSAREASQRGGFDSAAAAQAGRRLAPLRLPGKPDRSRVREQALAYFTHHGLGLTSQQDGAVELALPLPASACHLPTLLAEATASSFQAADLAAAAASKPSHHRPIPGQLQQPLTYEAAVSSAQTSGLGGLLIQPQIDGAAEVDLGGDAPAFLHVTSGAVVARVTTNLRLTSGSRVAATQAPASTHDQQPPPSEHALSGSLSDTFVLLTPSAAGTVGLMVKQYSAATSDFMAKARRAWDSGSSSGGAAGRAAGGGGDGGPSSIISGGKHGGAPSNGDDTPSIGHTGSIGVAAKGAAGGAPKPSSKGTSPKRSEQHQLDLDALWSRLQPMVSSGLAGAQQSLLSSAAKASHVSLSLRILRTTLCMPFYTHAGPGGNATAAAMTSPSDVAIGSGFPGGFSQQPLYSVPPPHQGGPYYPPALLVAASSSEASPQDRRCAAALPSVELAVVSLECVQVEARGTNVISSFVHATEQQQKQQPSATQVHSPTLRPSLNTSTAPAAAFGSAYGATMRSASHHNRVESGGSGDTLAIVETILRQVSGTLTCNVTALTVTLSPSASSTFMLHGKAPSSAPLIGNSVELPTLTVQASIANESAMTTGGGTGGVEEEEDAVLRGDAGSSSVSSAADVRRATGRNHVPRHYSFNIYRNHPSTASRTGASEDSGPLSPASRPLTNSHTRSAGQAASSAAGVSEGHGGSGGAFMKVDLHAAAAAPVVNADSDVVRCLGGLLATWSAGGLRHHGTIMSTVTSPLTIATGTGTGMQQLRGVSFIHPPLARVDTMAAASAVVDGEVTPPPPQLGSGAPVDAAAPSDDWDAAAAAAADDGHFGVEVNGDDFDGDVNDELSEDEDEDDGIGQEEDEEEDTPLSVTFTLHLEPGQVALFHERRGLLRDQPVADAFYSLALPRFAASGSISTPASMQPSGTNAASVDIHFGDLLMSPTLLVFARELMADAPCLSVTGGGGGGGGAGDAAADVGGGEEAFSGDNGDNVGSPIGSGSEEVYSGRRQQQGQQEGENQSEQGTVVTIQASEDRMLDSPAGDAPAAAFLPVMIVINVHPFSVSATAHPVIDDLQVRMGLPSPLVASISVGDASASPDNAGGARSPLLVSGTISIPSLEVVVAEPEGEGRPSRSPEDDGSVTGGGASAPVLRVILPGIQASVGYLVQPKRPGFGRPAPAAPPVLTIICAADSAAVSVNGARIRELLAFLQAWDVLYLQAQAALAAVLAGNASGASSSSSSSNQPPQHRRGGVRPAKPATSSSPTATADITTSSVLLLARATLSSATVTLSLEAVNDTSITVAVRGMHCHVTDTSPVGPPSHPREVNTLATMLVEGVEVMSRGHLAGGVRCEGLHAQWMVDYAAVRDMGWPSQLSFKPGLTWAAVEVTSLTADLRNAYTDARLASAALDNLGAKMGHSVSPAIAGPGQATDRPHSLPASCASGDVGAPVEVRTLLSAGTIRADITADAAPFFLELTSDLTVFAAEETHAARASVDARMQEVYGPVATSTNSGNNRASGGSTSARGQPQLTSAGAPIPFGWDGGSGYSAAPFGWPSQTQQQLQPQPLNVTSSSSSSSLLLDDSAVSSLAWGVMTASVDSLVVNLFTSPTADALTVGVFGLNLTSSQHPEYSQDVGADRAARLLGLQPGEGIDRPAGLCGSCGLSPLDVIAVHRDLTIEVARAHVHRTAVAPIAAGSGAIGAGGGGRGHSKAQHSTMPSTSSSSSSSSSSFDGAGKPAGGAVTTTTTTTTKIMQFPRSQLELSTMRFVAERYKAPQQQTAAADAVFGFNSSSSNTSALAPSAAPATVMLALDSEVWYTLYSAFKGSIHTTVNLKDFDWLSGQSRGVTTTFASRLAQAQAHAKEASEAVAQLLQQHRPVPSPLPLTSAQPPPPPSADPPVPLTFRANHEKAEADGRPSPLVLDPQLSALGDMAISNVSWLLKRVGVESLSMVPPILHDSVLLPGVATLLAGASMVASLEASAGVTQALYPPPDSVVLTAGLDGKQVYAYRPLIAEAAQAHPGDAGEPDFFDNEDRLPDAEAFILETT